MTDKRLNKTEDTHFPGVAGIPTRSFTEASIVATAEV
jgi:hypothetical protein